MARKSDGSGYGGERSGNVGGGMGGSKGPGNGGGSGGNIAPGVPEGFVSGMKNATARRTPNPTTTRPATVHNIFEAIKSLPTSPVGVANLLGGAFGVPGLGPQYEGPQGMANTPGDYDPTNRAGTNGGPSPVADALQSILGRPLLPAPSPAMPTLNQPAQYVSRYLNANVPGLDEYGLWTPFMR